jgi:hypothetical protein
LRGVLWGVVERLDLLRHAEVFVGDGAVSDLGVDHRHPHRLVAQQRGDRFEGHAAVDRLGRESVSELVRGHPPDPRSAGGGRDGVADALFADPSTAFDEQPWLAQSGWPVSDPLVEHVFELGVPGDVWLWVERQLDDSRRRLKFGDQRPEGGGAAADQADEQG